MLITWDPEKEIINLKKHGIDFKTASHVFDDPYCIIVFDEIHSEDEMRYKAIGRVRDLLFVVFAERTNSIRLISARYVTLKEAAEYYEKLPYSVPR